ncbi:T-lymphocyte activation antigen CD86 isoform X2 [Choloepus didactylus]|uniref:T-lymphocyte activation antigen CD86 isoform X2 n=1 Tax=Choloepus didactylus TaxID=27675 RepID=UPI00189F9763|nr:T-lymphocyte activation antigen CD86 isoform X2 [Choloepus didactylus]
MDAQHTMGLNSTLLVMALLLSGAAAALKRRAYFNETADLPCQFTNPRNISLSELVVFWQDQEKLVLYELYLGKEKPDNVDPKYVSRTSFDRENWILHLHSIQIKDQGSYQCFIHHKRPQGLVPIYQKDCDLSVFANFSQPDIRQISNITGRSDINLTCSSVQGYPEPKEMYFLHETENLTTKHVVLMQKSQDNDTELYNVSISFSFLVPHDTNNVSVICVLQPEPPETELHSKPFSIGPKKSVSPKNDKNYILQIVGLILLPLILVCWIVLFLIKLRRQKRQPKRSHEGHECETVRVEGEKSQQSEERVEDQALERSDEEPSTL